MTIRISSKPHVLDNVVSGMAIKRMIEICRVGDIPVGKTKPFRYGVSQGIAYNDGGVVKAYVNRCTHMGGPVELATSGNASVFRCRWHQAEFNPGTGEVICGQAPSGSALTPVQIIEEGGILMAVLELSADPFE